MKSLHVLIFAYLVVLGATELGAQVRWSADEIVRAGTGADVKMGFNNTHVVAAIGSTRFMTWIRGDSLVVASSQNGSVWGVPVLITKVNALSANLPTLAALSDGKLCVGWTEAQGLKTSFSADGGKTWLAAQTLASKGGGVCLAAGEDGVLYALWHSGGDDTPSDIMFATWQNGVWSPAKAIDVAAATNAALWGSLCIVGNRIYAVWRENTTGQFRIYLTRSQNGGMTWDAPRNIITEDRSGDPSVAESSGQLVVAYQRAQQIYTTISTDDGITFNPPRLMGNGLFARIVSNQNGFFALAWERFIGDAKNDQTKQVGFAYSTDYGYVWSADSALTPMGSKLALVNITAPSELTITWLNTNNSGAVMAKRATHSGTTSVRNGVDAAPTLELSITPSPIAEQATVRFALPKRERVKLVLYDVLGREIAQILDKEASIGEHIVTVNQPNLPGGVYFVRLQTPTFSQTQPVQVLR